MNFDINHEPRLEIEKIIQHYTEKDGVEVKYVCTTDLRNSDVPWDIFFRETPHPDFGNRYFGLANVPNRGLLITDADLVEELEFGMIMADGKYHYSQSHHDCKFIGDQMIDGGRKYIRSSGVVYPFAVSNGEMRMTKFPSEDSGVEM